MSHRRCGNSKKPALNWGTSLPGISCEAVDRAYHSPHHTHLMVNGCWRRPTPTNLEHVEPIGVKRRGSSSIACRGQPAPTRPIRLNALIPKAATVSYRRGTKIVFPLAGTRTISTSPVATSYDEGPEISHPSPAGMRGWCVAIKATSTAIDRRPRGARWAGLFS